MIENLKRNKIIRDDVWLLGNAKLIEYEVNDIKQCGIYYKGREIYWHYIEKEQEMIDLWNDIDNIYVDKDIYELGLIQIDTPMGNKVKAYDMERCICDIIRSKNRMDLEHVKYSIREYIKSKNKDLIKLSKYADKMGIKKEVMDFVEVFYE